MANSFYIIEWQTKKKGNLVNSSQTYPSFNSGIAILLSTTPVSLFAILTSPSVPAEYSFSPSTPNPKHRQLPLCLLVCQTVSMCPNPFRAFGAAFPTFPPDCSSSSASSMVGGRRKVWTRPDERPTETIGSVGWIACAKRSEERGRVQIVSNMVNPGGLIEQLKPEKKEKVGAKSKQMKFRER